MKLRTFNIHWNKYTNTYTGTVCVGNELASLDVTLSIGDAQKIADTISEKIKELVGESVSTITDEMRA
jgi:hypothetical protein